MMQEGFHWTSANIWPEEGSIVPNKEEGGLKYGFAMCRHYFLVDLSEEPQWTAWLKVYAKQVDVLSQFRVSSLSPEMVVLTEAWNDRHETVYFYNVMQPGKNYNAFYG